MRKFQFISIIAYLLVAISCGEDVLVKENKNNQTTGTYYKTASEVVAGVNSIYSGLQGNNLGGREYFFLHDLRGDEMASGGGQLETHRNQMLTGQHDPANGVAVSVWTGLYRVILRANAIIVNAPEADMGDEALKARCIGEAKFLRAWAYYQLYGFWGRVPIYEEYALSLDAAKPRAELSEVKALIVSDLTDAIASLPNSYTGGDLGRATKIAAQSLLAKAYMFDAQYAEAKPLLEDVIAYGESVSGGNPLMDDYFDNFTEEGDFNKESIFEISYLPNGYNWDADGNGNIDSWVRSQEYSAIAWRNLIPSDKLLAEFEDGDPRLNDNFYFIGDTFGEPGNLKVLEDGMVQGNTSNFKGTQQKVSWKKYSVMYKRDPGGFLDQVGINCRVMRYAEIYLLLAEVENEIGTPAKAIEYLNKTRNRPSVSMPEYPTAAYPTGSKAEIFNAIMHERMVEFPSEQIRNFDILRWRKAGKFTVDPISYFAANKYELLPIPAPELDANPNIESSDQNPGY